MNPKISIILPSIRPQNLEKVFSSIQSASRGNSFEVIIPSPYLIPQSLMRSGRVKFVHTYNNPTVSFMEAASLACGEFLVNFTDDALYLDSAINNAINVFETSYENKDCLNLNYVEGVLDPDTLDLIKEPKPFPPQYWVAGTYNEYRKPSINPAWQLAPHFFMKRAYFEELGGLDAKFEYINYNLHDLSFRIQADNGRVFQSTAPCSLASHLPDETGDHFAIHNAHNQNDVPLFNLLYSKEDAITSRIKIPLDGWKSYAKIWERRFNPKKLALSTDE